MRRFLLCSFSVVGAFVGTAFPGYAANTEMPPLLTKCSRLGGDAYQVIVQIVANDWRSLEFQQTLEPRLDQAEVSGSELCRRQIAEPIEITMVTVRFLTVEEDLVVSAQKHVRPGKSWANKWNIVAYFSKVERDQAERADRAAEEAQRQASIEEQRQESLALQAKFMSDYGVKRWVGANNLKANPFPYQDSTVGTMAQFIQMTGDEEALFSGEILVSEIPNTLFTRRDTMAILAIEIVGIKPVKTPMGGEMPLPHGRFVGAYVCQEPKCADFIGPPSPK